ncbi:TIGR01457 family HAD-type hydrolase [Gemella sp. GH3]|uniref:TIGR01457 family HAD-type hydrolase n=1 Tax=unclassified Gemella TaxID=2624949 RepID=UPI0015CFF89B|nr:MULTISPECIES: TIGR01457 family HAD-type hydrolase [unclassified Gemella]MBF0713813.1 TIGR01457 family HAD-type hydrolase [Gemella sp. GH3.1]NYS50765.1 TIGR01457 family HAD-type hydrolase [Gemella sp. GH3]
MKIKSYKLYLIDLDGTIYNGNKKIDYAKEFIDYLNFNNIDYLFLTNNSTRLEKDVVDKLKTFGIVTTEKNVFTSSVATSMYLLNNNIDKIYVIGEKGLKTTLESNNISLVSEKKAQAVVVGLDRLVTYDKLTKACQAILRGAKFIATNPDKLLPTEQGMALSNGGQVKLLEYASDTEATVIGKPNDIIMELAMSKFGCRKEDIVMIGDNYDTDILAGINSGIDTIHVQTGVTTKEQLLNKEKQPTYSIENLSELL